MGKLQVYVKGRKFDEYRTVSPGYVGFGMLVFFYLGMGATVMTWSFPKHDMCSEMLMFVGQWPFASEYKKTFAEGFPLIKNTLFCHKLES